MDRRWNLVVIVFHIKMMITITGDSVVQRLAGTIIGVSWGLSVR